MCRHWANFQASTLNFQVFWVSYELVDDTLFQLNMDIVQPRAHLRSWVDWLRIREKLKQTSARKLVHEKTRLSARYVANYREMTKCEVEGVDNEHSVGSCLNIDKKIFCLDSILKSRFSG
jgi:hypothetical protein